MNFPTTTRSLRFRLVDEPIPLARSRMPWWTMGNWDHNKSAHIVSFSTPPLDPAQRLYEPIR